MTMCGRILFGIGGCFALITTIQLIIAIASPSFAMAITGAEGESRSVQMWGLTESGTYCWDPKCIEDYEKLKITEDDWEKNCEKTGKPIDASCSGKLSDFSCFCTYGDKDKFMAIVTAKGVANVCDPNTPTNKKFPSQCGKFQYKDNEEFWDAVYSARNMTMMMLIVAIIFSILMTITSYASAALLHPIGGWVTVCLHAMTLVFCIIAIMTSLGFGSLITTSSNCGSWDCYSAQEEGNANIIVASAYLSQLMILVGAIQTYIALCLVTIATFVAKKASASGDLGEKLT